LKLIVTGVANAGQMAWRQNFVLNWGCSHAQNGRLDVKFSCSLRR